MNKQQIQRESISALADGQLRGEDFACAMELAHSDADARLTWQAYHVVGDVLRSGDLASCALGDGFVGRLQARLRDEQPLSSPVTTVVAAPVVADRAANDSVFRWKLVAGLASMVAVGAIGWSVLSVNTTGGAGPAMALGSVPPLAQASLAAPVLVSNDTAQQVMIRDPNLDALLAAHKQLGTGGALRGSTGFLRNATFEGAAR